MEMKIVFLDRMSIRAEVELIRPSFDHEWVIYEDSTAEQVIERAHDADIIITNKVPIRAHMLDSLPKLKLISLTATGYNIIDVKECTQRGIITSNIRNYANAAVPEHFFTLLLALSRSLLPYSRDVEEGRWQASKMFTYFDHSVMDLAGKTLGIIGKGALGTSIAKIAEAFGMEVLFAEHKNATYLRSGYHLFEEVLRKSHVLSVNCPLLPETRDLIAEAEFAQMEQCPIIVNTARGGIVKEEAIEAALDQGHIRGFATDVLSQEPPSADHPLMKIAKRDDILITPHMAWASVEAVTSLWQQLIANMESWYAGAPKNVVSE